MSLLSRLVDPQPGEEKIACHQFMAALAEYRRGAVSPAQIVAAFNLDASETTQLQNWLDNLDADTINRQLIHDVLLLGEVGLYTQSQVAGRLGV